jgi:hypothetical protein
MGGPIDSFSNDGRRLETVADWRNHHQGYASPRLRSAPVEGEAQTPLLQFAA